MFRPDSPVLSFPIHLCLFSPKKFVSGRPSPKRFFSRRKSSSRLTRTEAILGRLENVIQELTTVPSEPATMPPKRGPPKKASTPPPAPAEDETPAPVVAPRGRGRPKKIQPSGDLEQLTAAPPKIPKGGQPTTTRPTRPRAQAQGGNPIAGTVAAAPNPGQTKTLVSQ
jgi:hypothetical protein